MEGKLSAFVDYFIDPKGYYRRYEKVEVSRREVRAWRKNGTIPWVLLQYLSEMIKGFRDVTKHFRNMSRYKRTVPMLALYIENHKIEKNPFAFPDAVWRQMGNRRYQDSDTRPRFETIMENLLKIGVDGMIE